MDILKIQVLKGPNFWSITNKKLIVFKLDIKQYEFQPSNMIPNFPESLKKLLPSLNEHRCSEGVPGGLFFRLDNGTWLGHIIEHVALELQSLAGMPCGFGRTFGTSVEGVYHVIFAYQFEEAGIFAGKAAIELVETLALGKPYTQLDKTLEKLREIYEREALGPSSQAIIDEAHKRNIPVSVFKDSSIMIFGHGPRQKKMWATMTSQTSALGVDIATDKDITKRLLAAHYLPIPESLMINDLKSLDSAIIQMGFPLVIKPLNGNHGRGITSHILTKNQAHEAFHCAKKVSETVLVERFLTGEDYRFLVINYKVVAVAKRTPAFVIGNGILTIQALIDRVNQDPKRGQDHENLLTTIKIDDATLTILKEKDLTLDSVLPMGELLVLKYTANLSSGGTATDVTDVVHPENLFMGEQIARIMNLDICGIDVIASDIKKPLNDQNGAIIEVNASPGFRMHLSPCHGKSRNVAAHVLDMLYPKGSSSRIPVIAVTGTNGKTTVVRLLAAIAKQSHRVGFTTTEGIYSNDRLIYKGDCSGPKSAKAVLQDPSIDFAILECARGGILREGLGFDHCDISIITNVSNDHLGLDDIDSLEELARVKGVIAEATSKEGYVILNADDDLVYQLRKEVSANVALFALSETDRIKEHCQAKGYAIFVKEGIIVLAKGSQRQPIVSVNEIPCTYQGAASCMVKNILPALLAGFLSGFSFEQMIPIITQFQSNAASNPGRMNLYHFEQFRILLDYAHNEGAYQDIKAFVDKIKVNKKVGIITAVGDRRNEDIEAIGYLAGLTFDEIIIRHNVDNRGRPNPDITELLVNGIKKSKRKPEVQIISDEIEALKYAIAHVKADTFIYHCIDDVTTAMNFIKDLQKNENLENRQQGNYHYAKTQRDIANHRWSGR